MNDRSEVPVIAPRPASQNYRPRIGQGRSRQQRAGPDPGKPDPGIAARKASAPRGRKRFHSVEPAPDSSERSVSQTDSASIR